LVQNKKNESVFHVVNLMVQFFTETFVSVALGYFIGKYLDQWLFDDRVILTYVFIVLGIFSGLWMLIKRVLKNIGGGKDDEKGQHN